VRLAFEALAQCRAQPRFADARLARQQYDLPLTRIGALPAAQQQVLQVAVETVRAPTT
jgi:hypothetical protein